MEALYLLTAHHKTHGNANDEMKDDAMGDALDGKDDAQLGHGPPSQN